MTVTLGILHFLTIALTAIVAGVFFAAQFALIPAMHGLSTRLSVELHQRYGAAIDRWAPWVALTPALCAVALLVMNHDFGQLSTVFTTVGLLGTVSIGLVSELVNMPINRRIASWSLEAIPSDYARLRRRWERAQVLRTTTGVIALSGYTIGGLAR